jgi:Trk K+ transport system NAD-binding subunit
MWFNAAQHNGPNADHLARFVSHARSNEAVIARATFMSGALLPPPRVEMRVRIGLHVLARMAPALLTVALYTLIAGTIVKLQAPSSTGWSESFFAIYTQLFEPSGPLPAAALSQVIYWITPIVGTVLVAQGAVRIGAEFIDPARRDALWLKLMIDTLDGHVVVCGVGHVGFRVAEELLELGERVCAIEVTATDFVSQLRRREVPVLVGDARRDELLRQVAIERAKAVVCATNDDLANLEIALDAKRMNPNIRVIMRMFDQRLAGKVGGALELDQSFSTSALAAPVIALSAQRGGVITAYHLGSRTRVICEVSVPQAWHGKTVHDVERVANLRVLQLGDAELEATQGVAGDTVLDAGARAVVDADSRALAETPAWSSETIPRKAQA